MKAQVVVGQKPGGEKVLLKLQAAAELAFLKGQALSVHPACRSCPFEKTVFFVPPEAYAKLKEAGESVLPMQRGPDGVLRCVLPAPPYGGSVQVIRVGRPAAVEVRWCCESDCPVFLAEQERYLPPEERGGLEQKFESIGNPCRFCTFYDHCARQLALGYVD